MEPLEELPDIFHVGQWRIDANTLTASRGDVSNALEPRAYSVIRYLAHRPNKLVSVDELMDGLWKGAVVTPNAVTRIVAQCRKAFEDDAKNPTYIETVSGSGYRLVAPVSTLGDSAKSGKRILAVALVCVAIVASVLAAYLTSEESEPTIAVIPFSNLTGDASLDYLADGVAEEVHSSLGSVDALRLRARQWSFRFRESDYDAERIGDSLGAKYLVMGSVRQNRDRLRISAQLVNASDRINIWSDTIEVDGNELFDGQDRISRDILAALSSELNTTIDFESATPPDAVPLAAAFDLYLRGRHTWHRRGSVDIGPAIDAFAEVVRLDPTYAKGWAALASAYLTYPSYSSKGYATWHLAEDAASKALDLDPSLAEPYAVLAAFEQDRHAWSSANVYFREAIKRGSNNPTVHYWYAEHLAKMGRYRDSLASYDKSLFLDPTYQAPKVDLAFAYQAMNDLATAAELFDDVWDDGFQNATAWSGRFINRLASDEFELALQLIDEARLTDQQAKPLRRLVEALANGHHDQTLIDDLEQQTHHAVAIIGMSRLGRDDLALDLINNRLDRGLRFDTRVLWAPNVGLREHPRFIDLVVRLGLLDYWEDVAWGDFCEPALASAYCHTLPREDDLDDRP